MTSLLKWLATNAINWDTGWHSALGTQEPQGQVPSLHLNDGSKRWKQTAPASPPVMDDHQGLNVASSSENFFVDTQGYLLCPHLLLQSLLPTNLYHFGYYRRNNYKNIHPRPLLLLGWTDIIPSVSDGP